MPCLTRTGRGLSPRVRGNPQGRTAGEPKDGSIPACAGEPVIKSLSTVSVTVYPRVCGGTRWWTASRMLARGLSPRVRGNHGALIPYLGIERSIPACAGEPRSGLINGRVGRVYPRVCGGTPTPARYARLPRGLSPRVRGNRLRLFQPLGQRRSIPACAGEPQHSNSGPQRQEVYPRVCGGTRPYKGVPP